MAYYPSPSPSPRDSTQPDPFTFKMTPRRSSSSSSGPRSPSIAQLLTTSHPTLNQTPAPPPVALSSPPRRKRLTARSPQREAEKAAEILKAQEKEKVPLEKVGSKGEVVIIGRRIRCKMCRYVHAQLCTHYEPRLTVSLHSVVSSLAENTSSCTSPAKGSRRLLLEGGIWQRIEQR